jgi:5-formyltetrahydrofolate cyclo-ligase
VNKAELRSIHKTRRKTLSAKQIEDYSLAIANTLLELKIWDYEFYHLFLPIQEQREVNTEYVLNILAGKDKNVVISKSNFKDLSMTHFLLTDGTQIKKNRFNIPEPVAGIAIKATQLDVVFVPLLAFDTQGNRVGYGKGFYDRFLADCRPETLKIGLSFFEAETEDIEASENDIRLDYCVTPNATYRF